MREELRISNLQEIVVDMVIKTSPLQEWNPKVPIFDVRTYRKFDAFGINTSD